MNPAQSISCSHFIYDVLSSDLHQVLHQIVSASDQQCAEFFDLSTVRGFDLTLQSKRLSGVQQLCGNCFRNWNLKWDFILFFLDNFYKVEGAKDALICGNGSDAG